MRLRLTDKRDGRFCIEAWRAQGLGPEQLTHLYEYLGPMEMGTRTKNQENEHGYGV